MSQLHTRRAVLASAGALGVGALLSACGNSGGVGGAPAASQASSTASGPVTLNFETWYPSQEVLQPAIDAFQKANPNIKINLRVLASQDYQKQLPLQLQGGESLDVVGIQVSAMTNNIKDQLRPVDTYADQFDGDYKTALDAKLLKQAQEGASDNVLYGIPMGGVASPFMYYNNEILMKAGIKTPPATIAELADAVKKIKATQPGVTTPVVANGEAWWLDEMLWGFTGQKSPHLSDDILYNGASYDQPAMIAGINAYKELFTSGAADTSILSLDYTGADTAFFTGKAAFLFGGSWEGSVMTVGAQAANKTTSKDFGAMAAPISSQGGNPAVRTLAEGGMGIPKSSMHVAEAAKFISFMVYGAGVDLWNSTLQYNPDAKVGWAPSASVLATKAAQEGFATMGKVSAADGSKRDAQQDFLSNVEGPVLQKVLRGKMSPEDAVKQLQKEWSSGRYPMAGK